MSKVKDDMLRAAFGVPPPVPKKGQKLEKCECRRPLVGWKVSRDCDAFICEICMGYRTYLNLMSSFEWDAGPHYNQDPPVI